MENVIIIGSGPAGHTAAIYAGRALLKPLMFEGFLAAGVPAGGQLTTTTEIENFPGFPNGISGIQLMDNMRQQSLECGTNIKTETISSIDTSTKPYTVTTESGEIFETKSIIIATGATAKRLNIKGESEYWNRGISACAVCDGGLPIFRNKTLVVVGGGDTAMEEALHLSKYASQVYIIHRRDTFRASEVMQKRVFDNDKIKIIWDSEVIKVDGDEHLSTVTVSNINDKKESIINASGLFYAIGHTPNTKFLSNDLLDNEGYIMTNNTLTNIEGVFACGDVQDKKYRQAITSAGTGCMAALDVEKYLDSK